MTKTRTLSTAMILALLLSATARAEGFDTSSIAVSPDLAARVPAGIREAGVLVGGSDNAYAPWEYLGGTDGLTPEGIDIDLADAMTAKWGLRYESRTADFASILPSLGTTYDVGISALSITNERMEIVNFVSYVVAGSEWAVKAGNPGSFDPADICGRVIAVQSGSWHETMISKENDTCKAAGRAEVTVLPFGRQTEAMTRVAAGGADATISGGATVLYAVQQSGGMLEAMRPVGTLGGTGIVGIAVPKADAELTQLIADTLNEMIADGTYAAILGHWGVGAMAIPRAEINPVVDR